MSITFGSVGDIIAVCILVKDCVHALSDTNGSAAEYQAVVRELYVLEKSLLEVGILSKTHATTPELTALFGNLETTINQCRASLVAFKAKTQRYEGHLGDTSTKGTARKLVSSSAKKILWQVQMRDDVSRFRAEVVAYSMSIDQLLAAATMHTMKAHNNTLITLFDKQDSSVKHLQTRLDEVNRRVTAGNNLLSALVRSTRANWLLQLGHDLKALMLKIVAVNLVTYAAVDKIQASVLDIQLVLPTLTRPISDPRIFYLEDAIGRVSTITLDFITSWDALLAVLEVRFQGKPGIKKVLKKEYVLQNRATGKDVNAKQKWETVFRPGLWFDMDMIFQKSDGGDSEGSLGTKCIRCHAQSEQPRGLGSTCLHCKHVLRIVDITDEASATTFAPEAPDSLVTAPPVKSERRIVHPVPPSGSGKRKRDDDPDEEPANFNRVRLIKPKKRRLNKDLPEQASSTEKRKQEDLMEIDVPNGSSKRHKYEDSQVDRCEQGHSAKTYLQKQQQQSEMKAWTSSQPMTDFNRSSGRENPSSFTTYRDGNEGPSSRSSPPKRSPSNLPKSDVARKRSVATEEDAIRAGIPSGYSYRNWDPEEEPIMLLGSVFDANSLGKWIYDWTVFFYGPTTPLAEMAGEFWLLLIQLAGKTKRAEDIIAKILKKESQEIVEDFLVSAERIWVRFTKLLKICEDYMWKAAKEEAGNKKPVSMGKNSGREFVESLFGKDRELEKTEELMMRMRLWSMRFDCNCEDILRYPRA